MIWLISTLAIAGISEQDYTVPSNSDVDAPDPCTNNFCVYYNTRAEVDCELYFHQMNDREDTHCFSWSWEDGPCTDDECPDLAGEGTCYTDCHVDGGGPWYGYGIGAFWSGLYTARMILSGNF